jgi:hypothetical protein
MSCTWMPAVDYGSRTTETLRRSSGAALRSNTHRGFGAAAALARLREAAMSRCIPCAGVCVTVTSHCAC